MADDTQRDGKFSYQLILDLGTLRELGAIEMRERHIHMVDLEALR